LWSHGTDTAAFSGLASGDYSLVVFGANGCSDTFADTISQPSAPIAITGITTDVLCFGASTGAIDITVAGGTTPYTFLWSNGAVTEDVTGLVAGNYNVTVTDANGCSDTFSDTILQPAVPIAVIGVTTDVLCFGGNTGAIDISV